MGIIKIKHKRNKHDKETVLPSNEQDNTVIEQNIDTDTPEEIYPQNEVDQLDENIDTADLEDMEAVDTFDSDRAVVSEDETQITENSRLYHLNNGTAVSVISATPTNYFDGETNSWQKIDNTLTDNGDEFENVRGLFKTRISKAEKRRAVSVGKKDVHIMWEFRGKKRNPDSPALMAITDNDTSVNTLDTEEHEKVVTTLDIGRKHKAPRKHNKRQHRQLYDRAVYNNVESNTDLEYCLYGDRIKENIIVREKSDYYRYVFALQTQGLKMRLSEDNLQIELYREKTVADGTIEQTVEFTIPAPYMYDAAGEKSDDVFYELEPADDGQMSFAVVASDEWINAEGRVFPITIDPQIIMKSDSVITQHTKRRSISIDSCLIKHYSGWNDHSPNNIIVARSDKEEIYTTLTVHRNKLNILNKRIASAILYLTNTDSSFAALNVNGKYVGVYPHNKLEIDLTAQFKSGGTSDIQIELTPYEETTATFSSSVSAPYIKIEYITNDKLKECKRDIDLVDNASGVLDIATGEFTPEIFIASGEGLSVDFGITQIFKQSSENFACGQNFRLNLNEKLERRGGDSIYTDTYGVRHCFNEYFYYIDADGKKVQVEKSKVSVNALGELSYGANDVFREEVSDSGLRASTTLSGVSGVNIFDQRQEEIKKIENQLAQYKSTLEQFVVVNTCTNAITYRFRGNLDSLSYNTGDCYIILPESEAYSLLSMQVQKSAMYLQDSSYELQSESLDLTITSLGIQKDAYKDTDENKNNKNNANINKQITNYESQKVINNGMRLNNTEQRRLIVSQLKNIPTKSGDYAEQVRQYYAEYLRLKAELEWRKKLTPVNYIIFGEFVKGFNESGELVIVSDHYNNAIAIERDKKNRITRVYDDKEKQIVFSYNHKGLLASVTDVRGRRTAITRSGNNTTIRYSNGKTLTITMSQVGTQNNDINYYVISQISTSDKTRVELSYEKMLLTRVEYYNLFSIISHGYVNSANHFISNIQISYAPNKTTILTSGDVPEAETYKFNTDGNLFEYYLEKDGKVAQAERYDYVKYSRDNVSYANKDTLNKTPLTSFSFQVGESTNVVLNQFNSPVTETSSWKVIHKAADGTETKQMTVTSYTYDEDRRVISECVELSTQIGSGGITKVKTIKNYSYNAQGGVMRTESYVDGEEITAGKSIEETVYDDKGRVVKSFTYNSLDTSSKFYKESETDEDGKVTAEIDETGENKTRLEYVENTDNVRTQTLPNGSKFSYGYDIDDNVTAITQSTEEGEENSTQTEYTLGEITKLTSGNNTVKYTYDYKRRKRNVYLNSEMPYVSFTYSDGITENGKKVNKVTAQFLNCDTAETVSDMHGNVLRANFRDQALTVCEYDDKDRLVRLVDQVTGTTATHTYDEFDKNISYTDGKVTEAFVYNAYGDISTRTVSLGGVTDTYEYVYKDNAARDLAAIKVRNAELSPTKDMLGRTTGKTIDYAKDRIAEEVIHYRKVGDHATNMPVSVRFGDRTSGQYAIMDRLQYKYDNCGNISEVRSNGILMMRYAYDKLNRLVREDNKVFGKTWLYAYDNNGNILSKREYAFTLKETDRLEEQSGETVMYGYMGDVLLSYGEEKCAYDEMGNPLVYRDKDIQWARGRQLVKYGSASFKYDGQGRRIKKGNISFTYDSNGRLLKQSNGLSFMYDNTGVVGLEVGLGEDKKTYFYRKDIQGNIIAILDSTGRVVVEYKYTAWGEQTIETLNESYDALSQLNPFRYRGYYYDNETGLYFLKTRYYDPETGRFISIDDLSYIDPDTINGLNLYVYCGDNPVMRADPNGSSWWEWLLGALVVVAVVALTVVTAGAAAAAIGAAVGVGTALVNGAMIGAAIGGLVAGGVELVSQGIATNWQSVDYGALAIESFTGAAYGAVCGMMGSTTSAGLRLGLRGAIVGISGLNSALHGVNQGKSAGEIWAGIGISMATSVLMQCCGIGLDGYKGRLSSSVLELAKLDGFLFNIIDKALIGIFQTGKTLWRNLKDPLFNWVKGW